MTPRPRPLLRLLVLALSGLLLAACGTSGPSTAAGAKQAPGSPTASAESGAQALAAVQAAGKKVDAAGSATYALAVTGRGDGDSGDVLKRTGHFVTSSALHQVLMELPDERQGHEGETSSLTFLYTPTKVLMDNPSVTAKTGRKWTRMPEAALQQLGADVDDVARLPIGSLLDSARSSQAIAPAEGDARTYTVHVPESAELALGGVAVASLQAKGIDVTSLPAHLTHDAVVQVGVDAQGRLTHVSGDVTALYTDITALRGGDPVPLGTTFTADLHVSDVGSTTVTVPQASDIGDFPPGS